MNADKYLPNLKKDTQSEEFKYGYYTARSRLQAAIDSGELVPKEEVEKLKKGWKEISNIVVGLGILSQAQESKIRGENE